MRAILSVSDKTGIVEFARGLREMGVELLSTGGTLKIIQEANIDVMGISEITGFPECLDGRVKTLHPAVHGGILAMRNRESHLSQIEELGIQPVDIVVINLYPFQQTVTGENCTIEDAIENIDIGGPTMLRSAAKNHRDVTVVCDPKDYDRVLQAMKSGTLNYDMRYELALKVFSTTAFYDGIIAEYLERNRTTSHITEKMGDKLVLPYEKKQDMRYGENPHQRAAYYGSILPREGSISRGVQFHGKEMSFNNVNDANAAIEAIREFEETAVVAVKHANPCGVAVGDTLVSAYRKAHDCDPISIFGGIVACNRTVDVDTANEMKKIFIEIVIAPGYTDEAKAVLMEKADIRLIQLEDICKSESFEEWDVKKVAGGVLIQDEDRGLVSRVKTVTKRPVTEDEMQDLILAMKVVKHTKSNGIVFVKDGATIAISGGQTNRIWAVENCVNRCKGMIDGSVMASDAFFPFDDCVDVAAEAGVKAIIQPGGSIKDQESIDKADEKGISMVFGGLRHFRH